MSDETDVPQFLQPPYVYLLLLTATFILLYGYNIYCWPSIQATQPLLSGLSATVFGSYLVVLLVDRVFRQQEQERKDRIRQIALERLRKPVNRHLSLLAGWYIAASLDKPDNPPESYEELFAGEFAGTV